MKVLLVVESGRLRIRYLRDEPGARLRFGVEFTTERGPSTVWLAEESNAIELLQRRLNQLAIDGLVVSIAKSSHALEHAA